MTLGAVTVTDPNASGLVCVPPNGSPLAPGASWPAPRAIRSPRPTSTPALLQPGLRRTPTASTRRATTSTAVGQEPGPDDRQDATEANYDSVGDVIHYTITATNTGNVTLASVTSPTRTRRPGVRPGQRLAARARRPFRLHRDHTVTQADLDAGHYLNTACVDDGQGGADQDCDDADIAGRQEPCTSASSRTPPNSTYDSVGDVIHYTITATNTGNVTLHNVTVTDPNAAATSTARRPYRSPTWPPARRSNCTATTRSPRPTSMPATTSTRPASTTAQAEPQQACDDANVPATRTPHLVDHQGRHRAELRQRR